MIIKIDKKNFDLDNTLMSGQCFRVYKEEDSFICVLDDRVIRIKQNDKYIEVLSNNEKNLENKIYEYFDFSYDYKAVINTLSKNTKLNNDILKYNIGYKILNQNPFEIIISYIISQNNRVSRISKSINILCEKYGKKILFEDKYYYLFPKYDVLKHITIGELRECGVGFRDKYIIDALENINSSFIKRIYSKTTDEALECLMKIQGIGLKVASCILLFSFHRFDCYPIDTWVKKFVNRYYNIDSKNINLIKKIMKKEYKEFSGIVVQYMYNYERNNKNKLI